MARRRDEIVGVRGFGGVKRQHGHEGGFCGRIKVVLYGAGPSPGKGW
ncbi:hypothetical protein [Variovorax sp. LjRoot178]